MSVQIPIQKKNHFFRVVFFILMLVGFQLFAVPEARADYWASNYASVLIKESLEKIRRHIEGVLLGAIKVQLIEMVNRQVGLLIGGGAGGRPYFITNYRDFLYQTPAQKTALYMNDFFTLNTRGKFSSANYLGAGDVRGVINNYPGYLVALGKAATTEKKPCVYDLDEYTATPSRPFQGPYPFRALDAYVGNPCNSTQGYVIEAERAFEENSIMEREIAAIQAQSSGFLGVEKNGVTVTPAGAIEALSSMNIQNMGNVITSASNPSELSGVIAAVVNRSITMLVRWGVGTVEANIQSQVGAVRQQVGATINDATRQLGPAAPYVNRAIRQGATNVRVNTNTLPPPTPSNERIILPEE